MTAAELDSIGLLQVDAGVDVSRFAIFIPADAFGEFRPVTIHRGGTVAAGAIVHGGTTVAENARIEEHAVVGKPELGYAVGVIYPGAGGDTVIGADSVIRAGAVIYADVRVGFNCTVGHGTLLRSAVQVGAESQIAHQITVERAGRIGQGVRCSPGSHFTSSLEIGDGVFVGAGVRTINDKTLTWRHPLRRPVLVPPRFDAGSKVGTGVVVLAAVVIGEGALVGAGAVVTRDVPAGTMAYGCPARVHGQAPHHG